MPARRYEEESRALARQDRVMARLVKLHGPAVLPARNRDGRFAALARAIVYQQLAGRAAAAIHVRFRALFDGRVNAAAVLALRPPRLRACGLSQSKVDSIRDLARHVERGTVTLSRLGRLGDEDVVRQLVQVQGIGRWTAEMFLMFELFRPDVWPAGDYGVRKGYAVAHGLDELPAPRALLELGARFAPYRSVAAWYCWRAADGVAWQ